jgi:hypothetical protein
VIVKPANFAPFGNGMAGSDAGRMQLSADDVDTHGDGHAAHRHPSAAKHSLQQHVPEAWLRPSGHGGTDARGGTENAALVERGRAVRITSMCSDTVTDTYPSVYQ